MPNRHGQDDDYRYGFNGMESDDEVRGTKGASYTTEFRQLDVRIGRWLSSDPREDEFPNKSPYISFSDNPLIYIDPKGDADYYTKKGFWLGTDGNDDGRVLVITSSELSLKIETQSRQGLNYSDPVERGNKAVEIPQGIIKEKINDNLKSTEKSNKENGGHIDKGAYKPVIWDEGPNPELTRDNEGIVSGARATLTPFLVDGEQQEISENVGFIWHIHPEVTLDFIDENGKSDFINLGGITPSGYCRGDCNPTGDRLTIKVLEVRGFKGNAIVVSAGSRNVNFYNSEKSSVLNITLNDFNSIGSKKSGVIRTEYLKEKRKADYVHMEKMELKQIDE